MTKLEGNGSHFLVLSIVCPHILISRFSEQFDLNDESLIKQTGIHVDILIIYAVHKYV